MGHLRRIRSRLGFGLEEVALAAGWPRGRLREIEASDDLDSDEAELLSILYGTEVDRLLTTGNAKPPPVAVLLRAQADSLDADSRFKIAECVTIARQVRQLDQLQGSSAFRHSLSHFRASPDYSHPSEGTPERLASNARRWLGLGQAPIASVTKEILQPLRILLVWAELPSWIDALSFANADTGPVIVSNPSGEHMRSAFGRRVSWAHELCHLFHDRLQLQQLSSFCVMAQHGQHHASRAYRIERRARAFSAYLLAPRRALTRAWSASAADPVEARVRRAMETFGLGYEATRSHLQNLALLDMAEEMETVPVSAPQSWEQADPGPDLDPIATAAGIPPQRAGVLFRTVVSALQRGAISEGAARELLRVSLKAWLGLSPLLERDGRYRPTGTFTSSTSVLA